MNARLDYLLPRWTASPPRMRLGLALWLLGLLASLILVISAQAAQANHQDLGQAALALYCLVLACVWFVFPSSSLLLALDSHQLRIPGAVSQAFAGLPGFALACIVPAMPILAYGGISLWTSFNACIIAILSGLLLSWVPRLIFVVACWLPSIFSIIKAGHHLPAWSPIEADHWLGIVWPVQLVLAFIIAHRYLQHGMPDQGLRAPMLVQFQCSTNLWGSISSKRLLAQTSNWLQPQTELGHSGPHQLVRSMRILLGGCFNPMRWRFYLRLAGYIAIYPLLLLVLASLSHIDLLHLLQHKPLRKVFFGLSIGAAPTLAIIYPLMQISTMKRRWADGSNDLPLIALLPGLGSAATQRNSLLRALACPRSIGLLAVSGLLELLSLWLWPPSIEASGLGLLSLATAYIAALAGSLHIIRRAPTWPRPSLWLASFAVVVMIGLSYILPMLWLDQSMQAAPPAWLSRLTMLDALLQLSAIGLSALLARRHWQRLHDQPHPFLVR